ncbi:MAG: membrane-bound O-acyltransferase family protein [Arcobacter sp.]|nr:MAG: membrane-bound O-acyltransferase family protein [Arcobacter sp.]
MLFNSYEFIFLFLPLSFFIYFFLLEKRLITGAKGFLVFASLFFYSWWSIAYLPLILSSMLFNYIVGNSLNENFKKVRIHKKSLLTFGVISNLALLGYFKYTNFFLENFNLAFDGSVPLLHLALPLAISFFTFQQIAYLVDSYRAETAEYDFLNYALFVTFFPQLIAGPIVHHAEMMPQFASKWNMVKNYKNIATGLFIFSIGLFKKVVIADHLALWANFGFAHTQTLTMLESWITSLSYTFQLYFDFSGYTDMAIGAALLFNIKLPINFNSPYKALDIQDFWRRWHITLSRFLRDYIYIPLGGNRKGPFRIYTNLLATFILGGIWHGAGWTFVFWGFLHGMALVTHRVWKSLGFTMPKSLAWFITFNFINIAWVFFRAKAWEDAIDILKSMFFSNDYGKLSNILYFAAMDDKKFVLLFIIVSFALALFSFMFKNSNILIQKTLTYSYMLYSALLFFISILFLNKISTFLYFNF